MKLLTKPPKRGAFAIVRMRESLANKGMAGHFFNAVRLGREDGYAGGWSLRVNGGIMPVDDDAVDGFLPGVFNDAT